MFFRKNKTKKSLLVRTLCLKMTHTDLHSKENGLTYVTEKPGGVLA